MTQPTEERIGELVTASNQLTSAVEGKLGEIDSKISEKSAEVTSFLKSATPETRYVQDITIGGSKDYLYPVWWVFPSLASAVSKISIARHFAWNAAEAPLHDASPHQAALLLELEGNGSAWSGDANFLEIKRFFERYNNTASHVDFRMYCKSEKVDPNLPIYNNITENVLSPECRTMSGLYLRGGGLTYRIIKNWQGDVTYHDGSDQLRRNIYQPVVGDAYTINWFVEPIPFVDLLRPTVNVIAFSDPQ